MCSPISSMLHVLGQTIWVLLKPTLAYWFTKRINKYSTYLCHSNLNVVKVRLEGNPQDFGSWFNTVGLFIPMVGPKIKMINVEQKYKVFDSWTNLTVRLKYYTTDLNTNYIFIIINLISHIILSLSWFLHSWFWNGIHW